MIDIEKGTKPYGTHSVTLPDGHVVTMRNMTGRDMVALGGDDFAEILHRLEAAVIEHDYGGDIFDQEYELVIKPLLVGWRTGSQESVVPPQNGQR